MSLAFANYKRINIPEGRVKKITDPSGRVLWESAPMYTNQVPISTDTNGSVFNGTGYKDNARLSSSGGVSGSAQNGSTTTGFIPFPSGDATVIRMKGVEWLNTYSSGHHYINFYDSSKKFLCYQSSQMYNSGTNANVMDVTRDANGVETVTFNQEYGTSNAFLNYIRDKAKFIRITAKGKGADMIVTINEEIA